MSKRILLDTNVLLDIALDRKPLSDVALSVLKIIEIRNFHVFVSATTVTDLWYIMVRQLGQETAMRYLVEFLDVIRVAEVNQSTINKAIEITQNDFEDAVQGAVALDSELEIIVTRNRKDFNFVGVFAVSPEEFVKTYT
jgi:predicted nucleic acid-binding protein